MRDVLYSDTAHNFGDDTETGVANVTMLIEDDASLGTGQERDHTGIESGGGGGTAVRIACCWCCDLVAISTDEAACNDGK